jgi:glutamyl-tRNA reductase
LLAGEFGVQAVPWGDLRQALTTSDVVIAATSSQTPLIGSPDLRSTHHGVTLIDLGMPRNIDPSVANLSGVELHDVDDLQQVVEQHRIHRQSEVALVETLLAEEMDKLTDQLRSVQLSPVITRLRQKMEAVAGAELQRTLASMPALDEEAKAALEQMAHRIASKLLHGPTVALRSASGRQIASIVCDMFDLRTDPSVADRKAAGDGPGCDRYE